MPMMIFSDWVYLFFTIIYVFNVYRAIIMFRTYISSSSVLLILGFPIDVVGYYVTIVIKPKMSFTILNRFIAVKVNLEINYFYF